MSVRLEDKASACVRQKAYCDKEFAESCAKKENKLAELEKLSYELSGFFLGSLPRLGVKGKVGTACPASAGEGEL